MSARPKRYRGFLIRRSREWYIVESLIGNPLQVCISWDHACRVIDAMRGD